MSGAGAPAVRPQHVEVSVEEKHVEVRVHDARKARSRESIKPAMVDETRTAKLYPSLRLKEDPSHAPAVKDETLQGDDRGEVHQDRPRNCTPKTRPERVRYQECEAGSRREH